MPHAATVFLAAFCLPRSPSPLSRVKNLAQDSSAEGWVFSILGCGFSDGLRWTSKIRFGRSERANRARMSTSHLGRVSKYVEPLVDGDDVDGGLVSDCEFVVAGGHGAVAFEPVDAAFHGVALLVDVGVERRWPAAFGLPVASVGVLVGLARDGGLDPASAQVPPNGLGRVGLVGDDRSGRVGGRPPPGRGTRMPFSTGMNWGLSPRCPAVSTSDNGFGPARRPGAASW